MLLARVVGNVWATRKDEQLRGLKLLVVQPVTSSGEPTGAEMVAADRVGAGVHELVLITTGSSARRGVTDEVPIDAIVIGIIDTVDVLKRGDSDGSAGAD